MSLLKKLFIIPVLFTMAAAHAADSTESVVSAAVKRIAPGVEIEKIAESEIGGLFEVITTAGEVVYVSGDGRYMIQGNLVDMKTKVDLTEQRLAGMWLKVLNKIDDKSTIIYAPEKVKQTITVFTDIDCSYCRKFHTEIPQLNEAGVAVRYLFFPRAGVGSVSYKKTVNVWCAKDRNAALTDAKNGKPVEKGDCENPIIKHLAMVADLGITGTPTIFTPSGRKLPGYLPSDRLLQVLAQDK
ncbi:hypothetical protein BOW53_06835 [Solemya pervernicosa gill symbiont]|uniref:Thiol:disulfide interchange protein n=2 Tax=Gammaproteobacteria incertae sedis TaxID=118884 RepID=A0A1T2L6A8_9GAMM|nr:DsbC family protein [Candidatus Reidiella endopervernicosa]OOZ40637.1 hypothetical protein BOW53_06835 [Solemya pervernicosa gill symbiont]QKQ27391.1 DsbC family protein [Candidatus Reidiella endopervernicosa]